ncbi:MAG TPA: GPW/gp25 family protein [Acidimicrobiales bacterium]|nr:GPW/gp25 family protein [Acidimicrobiales bacterium]
MPPPQNNNPVPYRPPGPPTNDGEPGAQRGSPEGRGGHPQARETPSHLAVPSFVGRGFAFPMGVGVDGGIRLTRGPEDLDASMRVILSTAPGERLMRPQFGCRIWDLVFEPVNFNTLGLMEVATREAIAQWEPRVEVQGVECVPDARDAFVVHIEITYKVRATNDRRNLVYPFYVIPREEA